MKEKIKSASFWVSAIGSVFLILGAFGVEIGDATASAVINGVCSLLVMFGIIVPDKRDGDRSDTVYNDDVDEKTDEDR